MKITIFGGSGFIGRHLAAELSRRGHTLDIPVRDRERAKESLILLPNVNVYGYNPATLAGQKKRFTDSDLVINLVGILNEGGRDHMFESVHGEFVRVLMDNCVKNQMSRIIHISAIGAAAGAPSAYLRSKAKGEQIIKNAPSVPHVIIRPSVVFGEEDKFINLFAGFIRHFPVIPLPMASAKFQPIYARDLARFIANVAEDDVYNNATLHAGGPEVFTLREIIDHIARVMNKSPKIIEMGDALSGVFSALAERVPFVDLITRDNCKSMTVPSICPGNANDAADSLGALAHLPAQLRLMFSNGDDYRDMRSYAGR